MTRPLRLRGLQFEIVTSLFVVVLAGLAIVAVVMGALAVSTVEDAALAQLRMGARQLEQTLAVSPRLADWALRLRTLSPEALGGHWLLIDERNRQLASTQTNSAAATDLIALAQAAREGGEVVRRAGLPLGDLMLGLPLASNSGEQGVLIGRVSQAELWNRLQPLLGATTWVLLMAMGVFVAFGSYLLSRRIVLPLRELTAATRRIAQGDLDVSIEADGSDELAELGQNFNRMAESLAAEHEALKRAHLTLSQSERLAGIGRLTAGVAHEVGNPVAAILGYVEVLLRDPELSSRGREMGERLCEEALRIRSLVRELLDLSRSDDLQFEPLSAVALLNAAQGRLQGLPPLAGVPISVEAEDELPQLRGDARRIEQILTNLIENAAHAVKGSAEPHIELSARRAPLGARLARREGDAHEASFVSQRAPDAVALRVTDCGPGIDPQDLPQLFEPFFTTKDPGQGTGLGLWNSHRLAELLGGRLEAESAPGRTCFSLILPIADTNDRDGRSTRSDHR